ncbi:polysaccharide deacetylase family protein [Vibrio sp. WXL210]|uniref:polysaccharide deacetylase family protein n=1 Tax=Vibrio sp. WXL210 TaxID=3450709 RepID=UPI003EC7DF16
MKVIQCWDDGLVSDIRLTELLRSFDAKATFNLCRDFHHQQRRVMWRYQENDVVVLASHELLDVYGGFCVANHSLSHPCLTDLSRDEIHRQVTDNKHWLEDTFCRSIEGFCYPFGAHDQTTQQIVVESGHRYARTVSQQIIPFSQQDPFVLSPSCHFLDPDFWHYYEQAVEVGVFYFWGHSYELLSEAMWQQFERKLARIAQDSRSEWANIIDTL